MRIGVFGTGGIGGYFGGRLAQSGEDVVFIARGEHLQAMRTNGLRVDSVKGDFVIKPVQATDDPKQVGVVDMILVGQARKPQHADDRQGHVEAGAGADCPHDTRGSGKIRGRVAAHYRIYNCLP